MRRALHRAATLLSGIALAIAYLVAAPISASADPAVAVIVVLRDGADAHGAAAAHGRAYGAAVSFVYTSALRGYAARVPADRLARLAKDADVAFVSEDGAVSIADGHLGELPFGVDRIDGEASTKAGANNTGPAIAVIDTGSGPHSDLNIAGGKNCSGRGSSFKDGNGHGTHVAGTIAAIKGGGGVVGMLPGAPIYSVRVLNNAGSGTFSTIICGIDWVTENAATFNIKVANMSLGGSGSDGGDCATTQQAMQKAICNSVAAGVTYVVAAGNSNADMKGFVPAAYDQVLSVTAVADFNGAPGGLAAATCRVDVDDTAADFSNFATLDSDKLHTIAAPGVCIKSTWKGGGYNTISGTSMASPHAAGTAAVCIASGACAGLSPAGIIAKLRADAAARPASYGFAEDPNQVTAAGSRYYGHLTWAGGY